MVGSGGNAGFSLLLLLLPLLCLLLGSCFGVHAPRMGWGLQGPRGITFGQCLSRTSTSSPGDLLGEFTAESAETAAGASASSPSVGPVGCDPPVISRSEISSAPSADIAEIAPRSTSA